MVQRASGMPLIYQWPVYVGWSEALNCRGMFASRNIKKGETVERCPLILIPYKSAKERLSRHPLGNKIDSYYYEWDNKQWCLPLGYAMLYNHSHTPSMQYNFDYRNTLLNYVAIRDIQKDEELTVNYNGDPKDKTPIDEWFTEHNGKKII